MNKHQITLSENTGATKESAPFLGHYVSLGDAKWDDFIAEICSESGLKTTMVEAIINFVFEQIYELEKQGLYMLHFPGGFAAYVQLLGGFPTADAAFDPNVNSVVVSIKLDSDLVNLLADIVPTIVTDATSTKVKITSVADEAMPKPYEIIHGCAPFDASGWNLKMTDAGANAYLLTNAGVKKPCLCIASPKPGQVESFRSLELLDGGDYKFWVNTRGGDAEGPLQSTFRKVKFLKVGVAPLVPSEKNMIIDKVTAPLSKNAAVAIAGDKIVAHSATAGGISAVALKLLPTASSAITQTYTVAANGKAINIASLDCGSATGGTYDAATLTLTYKKAGADGATENLVMPVTVIIAGPVCNKVSSSYGENIVDVGAPATAYGQNLQMATKFELGYINDQAEDVTTGGEFVCVGQASGESIQIPNMPNLAETSWGAPDRTKPVSFAFYDSEGSLICWSNSVSWRQL